MPSELPGIHLKFRRAHEHLYGLEAQINAFTEKKPYHVTRYANEESLRIWGIVHETERPDPMWSVIVGDAIHDLRSALDHLIWQLVIEETGAVPPGNDTQFPIFLTEIGYKTRGEPRRLKGVGAKARALIKSLQPFATGEGEKSPLWHLHELSNWDKHRDIVLAAAMPTGVEIILPPPDAVFAHIHTGGPLEDGAVLWEFRFGPSPVPFGDRLAQVKVKVKVPYKIALKQPSLTWNPNGLLGVLEGVANRAKDLINQIAADCL